MTALQERPAVTDRFAVPLYTAAEAARYLGVPASTLSSWTGTARKMSSPGAQAPGPAVVTALPRAEFRGPVIPFIGLAEALVLTAMRRSGVPLQRIRPALAALDREFGVAHALASRCLFTDGAEILYDYAERSPDSEEGRAARELVVVRNGQRVFNKVVEGYLRRVQFDALDGYARLVHLPAYETADVVVDLGRGFGQPIFARGGARLEDALAMFNAGEALDTVVKEYGVPREQLEDALRVAVRPAA